ncbi:MAG: glutamate-1-semialdehyde-2,1-aminomutase [Chloroflexi bacterium]|nr:MAG: glutamate-1-semialdehyde-2,1-aminomutase [Chloroflexota bacterium]
MDRSAALFEEAKSLIPGGVNSPVRAHGAVGGIPPFIVRGEGPWVWDVDGNRYLDLIGSWGPLILGHRPAAVIEALQAQLARGWTFGAPTEAEVRLASLVSDRMPAIEMLRLVNSGTEAAMSAVRLARAFTGRRKLIKFAGAYHGHADALLVEAGSGVATLGIPGTPGITPAAAQDTVVARYNNLSDVESAMARWPRQVAAVIVEPVAGNMGVVPPMAGFLAGLREMTRDSESLLIFDEVITGFRVARGGAQELYGVTPDLTCLGKVLGGGLPIGGYGGRREIMEQVAPAGPVYQAGTLSGNPLAVAAGLATLDALDDSIYRQLESVGARVAAELASAAAAAGVPLTVNRVGSMLTAFFAAGAITEYATAKQSDTAQFAAWFRSLLARGVSIPPSQFEAAFLSTAHDDDAITFLHSKLEESFTSLLASTTT